MGGRGAAEKGPAEYYMYYRRLLATIGACDLIAGVLLNLQVNWADRGFEVSLRGFCSLRLVENSCVGRGVMDWGGNGVVVVTRVGARQARRGGRESLFRECGRN